jgi:hypothetical protein
MSNSLFKEGNKHLGRVFPNGHVLRRGNWSIFGRLFRKLVTLAFRQMQGLEKKKMKNTGAKNVSNFLSGTLKFTEIQTKVLTFIKILLFTLT